MKPTADPIAAKPYIVIDNDGNEIGKAGYNHFYWWADGSRGAWMAKVGNDLPLVARNYDELIDKLQKEYPYGPS